MTRPASARAPLLLLGLGYLVFVVYGSLVPLEFRALPWDEAVARFRAIPFLDLGIGSRADWVANLLLFIPLAFFWTGILAQGRGWLVGALASGFVLAAALALSIGIEFTQLFFPQRTVSQNDIFAEALGGLLGVLAWWGFGARALAWHAGWSRARAPADLAERLAWAYLVGVYAYNLLPLDLTISVVEIFHQWREGKLVFIPFSALPADPALALYEVVTDALIWTPLALLWQARPGRGPWRAWRMAFLTAALLEFLQLFVYSRVSDSTDLFTAALGAGLGAWLGARWFPARAGAQAAATARQRPAPPWLPLLLAMGWIGVLLLVFWYPFDFRVERAFIEPRLEFFTRVPFITYYYGTEFRAVTSVFQKVLFFAPLGALLAWFVSGLPWLWRAWAASAAFLLIPAVALGIELGQVLLPEKFPDTTDWFLESLGGYLGYALFRMFRVRATATRRADPGRRRQRSSRLAE
jgi:glycopeptide antibiotics resistance protein